MTTIEIMLLIAVLMVAIPYTTYLTVKLSTYAFYRGRQLFQEKNRDGENKSET